MNAAFDEIRSHRLDSLDIGITEYRHRVTGARHFHFATEHAENVFMVAFRTLPEDSTGVAHVLEHTVLCGSEKYPVRDPFFLMIRRSLNTFMNAFTASDYTAYPFASQNARDFDNLLGIYLDAVFFPRLDPLDFAQEGHRLEFEDPGDSTTPLVHRGVVFNEMKGDASSPTSVAWEALSKHLYPTTTYHYNSGGDPADIPDLTYDALVGFHNRFYQPANAIFMTFGDRPAAEVQDQMQTLALGRFAGASAADVVAIAGEERLTAPIRRVEPVTTSEDGEAEGQVLLGWLLGRNTDVDALMRAELLSDLLLDTSASPLRAALEQTSLGRAPSVLCGLEESNHEMCFVCGLEGAAPEDADAIEELILRTLAGVAADGVPADRVAAVLHQLELHRREIGGDGYPYGLQLMFGALPALIHSGDPIPLLDLGEALEKLARDAAEPGFVESLARELLIDNPHRVRLTLTPEPALAATREQEAESLLEQRKMALPRSGVERLLKDAAALAARQAAADDVDLLPCVTRADIPAGMRLPEGRREVLDGCQLTTYAAGTNGIVYQQVVHSLPAQLDDVALLPVLGSCITEVGSAGRGFAATQHLQHSICGGITAYSNIRGLRDDAASCRGLFVLSSRALQANTAGLAALLQDTAVAADFAERGRLRDLVRQMRVRRDAGITGNAHGLAMTAAAAVFSPGAAVSHQLSGLAGILALRELDAALDSDAAEAALADRLTALLADIVAGSRELLVVAEPEQLEELARAVVAAWPAAQQGLVTPAMRLHADTGARDQVWLTNTQVSFCAQAHPTVPESHPDSAALAVLGGVLRNAYLHSEVREKGGAYGVGAGQDGSNGVFRFYSYRDPLSDATFDTFERSIEWVQGSALNDELIEEAVLQIVSSIDAPASPAGEARSAFLAGLHGRDADARRRSRAAMLKVSTADVRRVAGTWLTGERSRCLVTGEVPAGDRFERFSV